MAYSTRKTPWKDELWNVSLLPTVKSTPSGDPPHSPSPAGGSALPTPAVLSLSETVSPTPWREAA